MKREKNERPMNIAIIPLVTAITEADRRAWWESGKGTYNAELIRIISNVKRFIS